jgi:hypothetical protein
MERPENRAYYSPMLQEEEEYARDQAAKDAEHSAREQYVNSRGAAAAADAAVDAASEGVSGAQVAADAKGEDELELPASAEAAADKAVEAMRTGVSRKQI